MDAKHTPGPWVYYTEPQPNGCPIVGACGLMVAMLAHSIYEPEQRDTALANASLIAAAPMLLEALQNIVASLSEHDDEGMIEHAEQMIAARAAIATATATQPEPTP